jgi:methanogenic corrinoid protein MtbC1
MAKKDILSQLRAAVDSGDRDVANSAAQAALDQGIAGPEILASVTSTLEDVGQKYQNGEYFLTELILSATAAEGVTKILTPHLKAGATRAEGKVVIGTVEGDIHDLGKSIVVSMLGAAGFEVLDLGTNVSASKFAQAAKELNADIVASCALMTISKLYMKTIEEELARAGIREQVRTMIGGAATAAEFAKEIGADGYGKDAFEAVAVAKSLVSDLRSGRR